MVSQNGGRVRKIGRNCESALEIPEAGRGTNEVPERTSKFLWNGCGPVGLTVLRRRVDVGIDREKYH
jgi:hypothetical protein